MNISTKSVKTTGLLIPILFLLSVFGCASREHLDSAYGKCSRAFYAKQRVYPIAATNKPKGLDSEEAAIVHSTYRRNLGGGRKSAKEPGSRVLLLQENEKR